MPGWITIDALTLVINVLFWIAVVPVAVLELWLTKRRAARYFQVLKDIADSPVDGDSANRSRNAARQVVYEWKW